MIYIWLVHVIIGDYLFWRITCVYVSGQDVVKPTTSWPGHKEMKDIRLQLVIPKNRPQRFGVSVSQLKYWKMVTSWWATDMVGAPHFATPTTLTLFKCALLLTRLRMPRHSFSLQPFFRLKPCPFYLSIHFLLLYLLVIIPSSATFGSYINKYWFFWYNRVYYPYKITPFTYLSNLFLTHI